MTRIGALIAAVIFAVLLGWTIAESFGPERVVLPTNGVVNGTVDTLPGGEQAREALAGRAKLQDWRAETGPSPSGERGGMATPEPLKGGRAERSPQQLVDDWTGDREAAFPMLRERKSVEGISPTLHDPRADVLIQEEGRGWRRLHNDQIVYGGGWIIFGMALLLSLFLLIRGRVRLSRGFSGEKVPRFSGFERANHWMTATSFVLLALTGLVILYGQSFLRPLLGAGSYGGFAGANLFVHIAFALAFTLGVLVMLVMWIGRNIPKRIDWIWLKEGGGLVGDARPPAEKFNAGQKLIFWAVILGGGALIATGATLAFPFFWLGIEGMQWALLLHAGIGLAMIAVILAHIYIGTVGMEGAFEAMWDGEVDRNWAEEHHDLWMKRREGRSGERDEKRAPRAAATPAE